MASAAADATNDLHIMHYRLSLKLGPHNTEKLGNWFWMLLDGGLTPGQFTSLCARELYSGGKIPDNKVFEWTKFEESLGRVLRRRLALTKIPGMPQCAHARNDCIIHGPLDLGDGAPLCRQKQFCDTCVCVKCCKPASECQHWATAPQGQDHRLFF